MGQRVAKLNPHIVNKIWGGKKISKWKKLENFSIGETWEVSTHKEGPSKIGDFKLSKFLNLSYLVKLIDTNDHLSVQVHPDDDYALEYENEKGKTECWLILEAEEGAGLYLGFKPDVTKKEFKTAVANNIKVANYLNFIPVNRGDFFVVPAGAIHAIGKGVSLLEVQQSSGVTYRVWDWGRVDDEGKTRTLHIEDAFNVLNFSEKFQNELKLFKKDNLLHSKQTQVLIKHQDFKAELVYLTSTKEHFLQFKNGTSFMLLEGEVEVDGLELESYHSYIIMEEGEFKFNVSSSCYLMVIS